MVEVGATSSTRAFRVSAATVAAVASVLGILLYAAGYISAYLTVSKYVSDLQTSVGEIKASVGVISERLTHVEDDARYAAQNIADAKALKAGTNR